MRILLIFSAIFVLFGNAAHAADQTFLAGFAKRDITPTPAQIKSGEIFLGGFTPGTKPKSIADHIHARALYFAEADGSHAIGLVVLDLPGISNRSIKRIQMLGSQLSHLPEGRLLVGATHTHYAPDLQGLWGGVSDNYRSAVEYEAALALSEAVRAAKPAMILASKGIGTNKNRRGWKIIDPELTFLDVKDAVTGARLGTLTNFAAHPVCNSDQHAISADYPGHLSDLLEYELGGVSVFSNGIVGDVVPPKGLQGATESMRYGRALARIAIESTKAQKPVFPAKISFVRGNLTEHVGNPIFAFAYQIGLLKYDLQRTELGELEVDTHPTYFRLGDNLEGVAFPGESLSRNGLPIKAAMKSEYKLFLGLTGDTLGYFVPSDEWMSGRNYTYEERISVDHWIGDHVRDLLVGLITANMVRP